MLTKNFLKEKSNILGNFILNNLGFSIVHSDNKLQILYDNGNKPLEFIMNAPLSIMTNKDMIISTEQELHFNPVDNNGTPVTMDTLQNLKDTRDVSVYIDDNGNECHSCHDTNVLDNISKEMLLDEIKLLRIEVSELKEEILKQKRKELQEIHDACSS